MFRKRPPAVASSSNNAGKPITAKRRFFRAPVELDVQYEIEGRNGWRSSRIVDLGEGGVRLESDEDIAAGTAVHMKFEVGGTPVAAAGRVAMSFFDGAKKRFGHGVAFTSIEPAQREAIVRRVTELQQGR